MIPEFPFVIVSFGVFFLFVLGLLLLLRVLQKCDYIQQMSTPVHS